VPDVTGRNFPVRFFDAGSGVVRAVGSIDAVGLQGISAASKERTVVVSRRESGDRDLMLMEFGR
jgi:hypothetical protein